MKKQGFAVAVLAVLGFIGMYLLVAFVHELAHAFVCENSGGKATIHFDGPQARAVDCPGITNNLDLYHVAGGLVGTAAATVIAFAGKKARIAFVVAFPFIVQQALITVLETFSYNYYIQNSIDLEPVTSLVVTGLFILLGVRYVVVKVKPEGKRRCFYENHISKGD